MGRKACSLVAIHRLPRGEMPPISSHCSPWVPMRCCSCLKLKVSVSLRVCMDQPSCSQWWSCSNVADGLKAL